jgi:hypothetical protein
MLNLHSMASAGILSTSPTSDMSSGVAFTSRSPENLSFAIKSDQTHFEMEATMNIPSENFAVAPHDIEVEQRNDP